MDPRNNTDENFFNLKNNDVHVFRVSLTNDDISRDDFVKECNSLLSPDEQDRVEKFKFTKLKTNYILCRGILRKILSRYLDINPNKIEFNYTETGKPSISSEQNKGIYFNLSHSKDNAVYAVTRAGQVGIDTEYIHRLKDLDSMIDYILSEKEKRFFDLLTGQEKYDLFFRYWTHKEAFLKATGTGLSHAMYHVEFFPDINNKLKLSLIDDDPSAPDNWAVFEFNPGEGFSGSLVVASGNNLFLKEMAWKSGI